ncbi:hypothetical protein TNCV_4971071 [Trichonephila clavipes]|nr:hypothetical protein TNCV_4971071 [Trichonephila clavipes]
MPKIDEGVNIENTVQPKILLSDRQKSRVPISTDLRSNLKGFAPSQPRNAAGFCNQRLEAGYMTMESKQMCFFMGVIYRQNSLECLSELLKYVRCVNLE